MTHFTVPKIDKNFRGGDLGHRPHNIFLAEGAIAPMESVPMLSIDGYFLDELILPNFTPIRFETTEPSLVFLKKGAQQK